MKTVKEYAEIKGVSHQAVYKMLQVHKDELEDYIIKRGRTRFLTDEAIDILEKYRESNPVIVEQVHSREQIEELENNIKRLLAENAAIANKLSEALEWKAEKSVEIAQNEANLKLLDIREEQYEAEKKRADKLEEENQRLQEELQSEQKKSWWDKLLGK